MIAVKEKQMKKVHVWKCGKGNKPPEDKKKETKPEVKNVGSK